LLPKHIVLLSLWLSIDFYIAITVLTKECEEDSAGAGASNRMIAQFEEKGRQDRVRVRTKSLQAALDAEILAVETGNVLREIAAAARHVAATNTPQS
jgi:hypothetical protein